MLVDRDNSEIKLNKTFFFKSTKKKRKINDEKEKSTSRNHIKPMTFMIIGGILILILEKLVELLGKGNVYINNYTIWFGILSVIIVGIYIEKNYNKKNIKETSNEKYYETLLFGINPCIWEMDLKSLIIKLHFEDKNFKIENIDNEIRFNDLTNYIHEDDLKRVVGTLEKYLNKEISSCNFEFRIKEKKSNYRWFLGKAQGFWDESEQPIKLIGTVENINKQKLCEKKLRYMLSEKKKVLSEIVENDKIKTEFFANISHDLRTPLNVILATIQLLEVYKENEKDRAFLDKLPRHIQTVKQNSYRLIRLVNNLVDLTKLEAGFMKLSLKNMNIVNVVEQITMSVADLIEKKSIELVFDTNIEEKIIAFDEEKLERIILNLLSNSSKFTQKQGKIWVDLYDKGDYVSIIIRDNGIGIKEDKLKNIFGRYNQVDNSLTRADEGSGIGLSLVKSLTEIHGGEVIVNSVYGKGSEFIVNLPVRLLNDKKENFQSEYNHSIIADKRIEKVKVEFSNLYFKKD
ncbi:MAG: PAS domain-containing sensor histidine kinase [Clostridiales bacterium]